MKILKKHKQKKDDEQKQKKKDIEDKIIPKKKMT